MRQLQKSLNKEQPIIIQRERRKDAKIINSFQGYVTDMINDVNDITIKTIKTVYKEIYSLI